MSLLKDVLTCHDASVIPLDARKADYSRVSILVVVAVLFVCSFFFLPPGWVWGER